MNKGVCYNRNMHKRRMKKGFTLVELSLSIGFIAVLSLSVALIVTNSISAYHRGVILDQVNTTGMEIVDDMRASIQSAQARSVKRMCAAVYEASDDVNSALKRCENDEGRGFVSITKYANVEEHGKQIGSTAVPVWGAFCSGYYSYIWNSGYFDNKDATVKGTGKASLKYKNPSGGVNTKTGDGEDGFRLLKVEDPERSICISAVGTKYLTDNNNINNGTSEFNIADDGSTNRFDVVDEEPYAVLSQRDSLALYELLSYLNGQSGVIESSFYSVSFILGTIQGGININSRGDFCDPPADYSASAGGFDYCAINKFNFAAQANGG